MFSDYTIVIDIDMNGESSDTVCGIISCFLAVKHEGEMITNTTSMI